ncbi:MAG: four helix bundle protein [Myxococcota bacterium]
MQLSKLDKRLQGDRQPVSEAPGSRPQRLTVFSHLKDQGCRAMDSVALNIAEGIARGRRATAAGRNHLSIAVGSAAEACAVLDWVHLNGGAEVQEKLRRVGIMLLRLGGG